VLYCAPFKATLKEPRAGSAMSQRWAGRLLVKPPDKRGGEKSSVDDLITGRGVVSR
jgi:hypothetical protein